MKKITLSFAFCAISLLGFAQSVLLDETFNYSAANLAQAPTWTSAGSVGTDIIGTIVQGSSLSYSNSGGLYALSGVGNEINSAYSSTSGGNDYKLYKSFISSATPVTSGVLYLSFLFNAGVAQTQTASEVMSFADATMSSGAKLLVGKGATTLTNYRFGTSRGSSTSADYKWASTEYSDASLVHLIVIKYDFSAQKSSLFVDPTVASTTEPTPDITDYTTSTIKTSLNGIRFRVNGASNARFNVGGVRVSTSWAAAVATPSTPLNIPAVGTATAISNVGFTANWTPVANAISYDVAVYNGTTLVSTTNVAGQTATSLAITGLSSNTTYNYKVIARGDGVLNGSSQPSVASANFTTAGLTAPVAGAATSVTDNSFTANWSAVPGAASYDVQLYLNTTLKSTTNVPGQPSASLAFTSLQMGTSYSYVVTAKSTGGSNLDSSPSPASAVITTSDAVSAINTSFNDGSWGTAIPTPSTNLPLTGSYPTWWANGFQIQNGAVYGITATGPSGETHLNVMALDKITTAALVFPKVNSLQQIEFHAYSGSDAKTLVLEELGSDLTTWNIIGTYNANKLETVFIVPLARTAPATFRLRNTSTSSMNITQVIVRNTNPVALAAPASVSPATAINGNGFLASWSTVPNATGYNIAVMDYGKFTGKNFVVTGQATNSFTVVGVDTAAVCTYAVAAIGDGISFLSSPLSVASTSFVIARNAPPVVGAATAVSNSGFTANWTPTAAALGYDVLVYQGTTLVSTTNATGQATSSLAITGLAGSTTYTFSVVAKGNGTTTYDSSPSVASQPFITGATGLNNIGDSFYITSNGKIILASESGDMEVYNLQGTLILQAKNVNTLKTNLNSGLYLVRFTSKEGKQATTKVIIK